MFCTNINLDNLEYKPPSTNKNNGAKVVNVSTVKGSMEWKDKIRFQMSESDKENLQVMTWGLSTPVPGQDASRRSLELTIESPDLLKFLTDLDEKNVQTAVQNAPEWFKKSLSYNEIKPMYVNLVRDPVKEGTKSTVRVKVKCGDTYPTNIYVVQSTDENGNISYTKGGPDDLTRNSKCMMIVETVGLWFMQRSFGMSLTAQEILVWPSRRSVGIDAFTFNSNTSVTQHTLHTTACSDDIEMVDGED